MNESEAFIGKATKGVVVVLYFKPLATQHMKASVSPFKVKYNNRIKSFIPIS